MDDKISQQIVTSNLTEDQKDNSHKSDYKDRHIHEECTHNHQKTKDENENNVLEFNNSNQEGQSYDEFYVSGVD